MADQQDEGIAKATAEANAVFARLGEAVEGAVREGGDRPLDTLEITRKAGLEIDETVLDQLQLPRLLYPMPFVHWCCWFPWRPLWCWWWHRHYPWYRCCPYWWHRCHPWW
jgi:hypothetical protein